METSENEGESSFSFKSSKEFKVYDIILKGDFGDLWQGLHVPTNKQVLVINVSKSSEVGHQYALIDWERISNLQDMVVTITHPNILKYIRIAHHSHQIGIVMEHPQGSTLYDFVLSHSPQRLSEREARIIFKQVVEGVETLHSKYHIVHRNLNLHNIFVNGNTEQVKLGDFLICTKCPIYKASSATSESITNFFAPEIFTKNSRDEEVEWTSDIWSLGVLLYVMTCGYFPFHGAQEFDVIRNIKKGNFILPNYLSEGCMSIIKMMLQVNPHARAAISAIKAHPWYSGLEFHSIAEDPFQANSNFSNQFEDNSIPFQFQGEEPFQGFPETSSLSETSLRPRKRSLNDLELRSSSTFVRQKQPSILQTDEVKEILGFTSPPSRSRDHQRPRSRSSGAVHLRRQRSLDSVFAQPKSRQLVTSSFQVNENPFGPYSPSISTPPSISNDTARMKEVTLMLQQLEQQPVLLPFEVPMMMQLQTDNVQENTHELVKVEDWIN